MIQALNNQKLKPSHYLLNYIHTTSKGLHEKQDKLQNKADFCTARRQGERLTTRNKGVIDLRVQWVPGHKNFKHNEKADKYAKKATKRNSSPGKELPKLLRKPLPPSISMICQDLKTKIQQRWIQHWKMSPHYCRTHAIDKSTSSKNWLKLISNLTHTQASLLLQGI